MYRKIERKLSRFYFAKPHRLISQKPIVSFTFDDVPASAVEVGAQILEKYNAAGTFYLSSSLAGKYNIDLPQYKISDIEKLMDGGHEIGCHTYSHVNIQMLNGSQIEQDLEKNKLALQEYLGDHDLVSFSYPFGCTSIQAKRVVRRRYATGRGIKSGLNKGFTDLAQLKANAIYSNTLTKKNVDKLIETNIKTKSWLIFYTHDISQKPTPYGCTPELFEYAVKEASKSGAELLCMRNALARASFRLQ